MLFDDVTAVPTDESTQEEAMVEEVAETPAQEEGAPAEEGTEQA